MREGVYEREETEAERLDRNVSEFLQELRVALPGVQVLFAFLLAVPFQQRFDEIDRWQEDVYFVTLLATAIATALLMSPTAFHRLTFRRQQKLSLVRYGNRLAIAGLGFLALAICGVVLLVTSFIFSTAAGIVVTCMLAVLFAVLWWGLPLSRLARQRALAREERSE